MWVDRKLFEPELPALQHVVGDLGSFSLSLQWFLELGWNRVAHNPGNHALLLFRSPHSRSLPYFYYYVLDEAVAVYWEHECTIYLQTSEGLAGDQLGRVGEEVCDAIQQLGYWLDEKFCVNLRPTLGEPMLIRGMHGRPVRLGQTQ